MIQAYIWFTQYNDHAKFDYSKTHTNRESNFYP